jgi:hypothetical protein
MNTPTATTTNMKATGVSITKLALDNRRAKHHKQRKKTINFLQNFTTASFCSNMTPSPPPSPKVPAASSKVTQEEQHSAISIETLEETIDFIENMEEWTKEFFQESKEEFGTNHRNLVQLFHRGTRRALQSHGRVQQNDEIH